MARDSLIRACNVIRSKRDCDVLSADEVKLELNYYHLFMMALSSSFTDKSQLLSKFKNLAGIDNKSCLKILNDVLEMGLLKVNGEIIETNRERLVISSSESSLKLQAMHLSFLEKAMQLVTINSTDKRYSATEFVSISKNSFTRIKKITEDYLDELSKVNDVIENEDLSMLGVCLHLNMFD